MAVKIRLSRIGKKHAPFYRIIAIDSRRRRDGKSLDILGSYNPLTGEVIQLHTDRLDAWISKGALQTDVVKKIRKAHQRALKAIQA
jgi:small subunit ribosomal protein S16